MTLEFLEEAETEALKANVVLDAVFESARSGKEIVI